MAGKEKIIIYSPRQWTRQLHNRAIRWKVVVAHRRAGKTTACLNHLIREAIIVPQSRYAFIAPTYKMAKNVAWDILKEYACKIEGTVFNEVELRCDFLNGSRITLYGSDNPDALRGMGLWGVVFDEYSQQPSNIFSEIIRPALIDHQGFAIWIGTPKGKNEFWRLYEFGKKEKDWLSLLVTVEETGVIPQEEIKQAQKVMTADEFLQEFYCSFEASIKGAYYATEISNARQRGRIKYVPYDPVLKVHLVWDLGVGQALGIGFYQQSGNETRMIDYWEGSNQDGIPQAIKLLQDRDYIYGTIFLPHDAMAVSVDTGKTRVQTIKDLWNPNIQVKMVKKMSVDDGISKGSSFWSHLWIDEKNCQLWLDYISQYRRVWSEKRGMFEETPYHDFTSHAADIHRYAALVENEMTNEAEKQPDYQQKKRDKKYYPSIGV